MKYLLSIFLLLFFAGISEASNYWVRTTGTMSGCTPSISAPATNSGYKSTIAAGIGCLSAGDTLIVQAGNYLENITSFPSGTSLNRITITSETPLGARIRAPGAVDVYVAGPQIDMGSAAYVTIDGFNIDGNNSAGRTFDFATSSNTILIRNEIHNALMNGINNGSDGLGNQILNNNIHDNGRCPLIPACAADLTGGLSGYGIYGAQDTIIDGNQIHHNTGYGLHLFGSHVSRNVIKNNTVHENGSIDHAPGMIIGGSDNVLYNNLIYNENGAGIHVRFSGVTNTQIYNNTIYNVGLATDPNPENHVGIYIAAGSLATTARNNIIQTGVPFLNDSGSPTANLTASNTLCGVTCTTWSPSNNPTPESAATTFISPGSDFHLKAGSRAIANGADLSATFTTDLANNARTVPWDIGAYKFAPAATCPATTPALVARYDFEGNGTDSTGNGRTATLGTGWTYTTGHTGQGALSNGTSGITVADHDSLDPCAAFTYEGWINLANSSGNYAFINKNPNSKAFLFASFYGYCGSGVPIGGYSEITNYIACSTTALTSGFKHLAVTYDSTLAGANIKLYLNGVQVSSADSTVLLSATTGTLQFCTSSFGETCPSGTVIDDIRIYNYARSASEILSSITAPPVFTIKLDVSSLKIGPSVSLKVGVP